MGYCTLETYSVSFPVLSQNWQTPRPLRLLVFPVIGFLRRILFDRITQDIMFFFCNGTVIVEVKSVIKLRQIEIWNVDSLRPKVFHQLST